MSEREGEGEDVFKCPYCGKIVSTLRMLKVHVKKYHPLKKCPVCGYRGLNIVTHMRHKAYSDPRHALYYYLHTHARASRPLLKYARTLAYKLLKP